MTGKVATYEQQIAALQAQLEETQTDADVQMELLAAGVKPDDMDYVMFKLKAKGKLERGERCRGLQCLHRQRRLCVHLGGRHNRHVHSAA